MDEQAADAAVPPVTPEEAAAIALDERLCLALYTASRSMTARYRVALEDLGLTYPQYLVMVLLWEEGSVPVGRIGERLSLESSTLSPLLKRLETVGLISRTRDRTDERLVIIGLTTAGRRMQERAGRVTLDVCEASGLTIADQQALVADLRALDERLRTSTREARSA
ncbi:MarR family winged helix-turn-helix transcriptional regulator [Microlunatus flavus]|uniref:DNA-binding transcriptional regulator, MarR family n=1 Tax=Microlunatus flavus TaxID=1036181 RepID=A0A1H9MG91_9ACTN|nr:MarR family transcriptional regulator [Microlunatus flavus]SER22702.1 DNA-binding transcriptional regulator, MarR family [Microlunatus flavus]